MKLKYSRMLSALTISLLVCTGIPVMSASAADGLVYYDDGTASYIEQGTALTGKFGVSKDYTIGDIGGDDTVSSTDAAGILTAAAAAGAGDLNTADLLAADSTFLTDAETAAKYADVNEDGSINASDAAEILNYAASAGAGADVNPLGFAYYYADENGILRTGFIEDGGAVYYAGEDHKLRTGWFTLDGARYYFGTDAVLRTGWQTIGASKYYFGTDGAVRTGWQTIDGDRYYFDTNGAMKTGWQTIGASKYYFNADGIMQTGWLEYGGKTYRFAEDGKMMIGWYTIDGNRYHFNASGIMYTGLIKMIDGTYYFSSEGIMQTGWQTIGTSKYYFNEDGKMQKGWLEYDGKTYRFAEDGKMMIGWYTIDGNRYHFNASGIMYTGLIKMIDGTYYFSSEGIMQTGSHTIDGVTYLFGEDGKMCTGWVTYGDATYYLDEKGIPYTGWLETDDGDYYFTAEGKMVTGFTDLGSGMVYFEPDGTYYGRCTDITDAKTEILENAELNPHDSYIIYNRQVTPEVEYMKITLKEKDIAILEEFAAEHFTEDMTMAQKLWITQQWIHKKVDYAYAGEKWNSIVNLSYVEAIYVNRMGQCVQYNGAMAAMMIWFGYDVYMVKGWTSTGNQHFWTEVVIDGETYLMECGNYGKNGTWHDFLTPLS